MKQIAIIFASALLSLSCRNAADRAETYQDPTQVAIDSMKIELEKQKMEMARQKSIDSMETVMAAQKDKVKVEKPQPIVINNLAPAPTPAERKRKPWSNTAKGAVIGAGVGAVTGAVVSKKKPGQGAVIGGIAGAGVGAGTGAILDAQKKKRDQQ